MTRMTDPLPLDRTDIDAELERVLDGTENQGLRVAREAIEAPEDRWYGQLVGATYAAVSDSASDDSLLSCAAAIELLRGYTRIRSRLLIQLTDDHPHSLTTDPGRALLAGDYLSTSAFTALTASPYPALEDGVEILATAFESITDAFFGTYPTATSANQEQVPVLDQTMGSLGAAATRLGASVAGDTQASRSKLATAGRAVATSHGIHRLLESDPGEAVVVLPEIDEAELRAYAETQRREAVDAHRDAASIDLSGLFSLAPGENTDAA